MKLGLQQKILIPTLVTVILSISLVGFFSYQKASQELWNALINTSKGTVESARNGLGTYIDGLEGAAYIQSKVVGIIAFFTAKDESGETKKTALLALDEFKKFDTSIQAVGLITLKGDIVLNTEQGAAGNVAEREYFKKALNGEINVSQPLLSKVSGKPAFILAAPVHSEGKCVGVLYARVDINKFSENMVQKLKVGKKSFAYVIDKTGLIFSHPDQSLVLKSNISEQDWGKDLLSHDEGTLEYQIDGVKMTGIYSKEDSTGWKIIIVIDSRDISESLASIRTASIFLGVSGIIVVCLIIFLIIRKILVDLSANVDFATSVSNGQLDKVCTVKRNDELGALSDALNIMVSKLKNMIETANNKSIEAEEQTSLAKSAMIKAEQAQVAAEKAKAEGMLQAANKLDSVVEIVTSASEELSAQIEQSSRGSEEQSRRVAETATAMEEMNATVLEVAKSASNAAQSADQAKAKAEDGAKVVNLVVKGIEEVRQQSQAMKADMDSLGKQAEGIGQILNVISDIADQTNLLALNAAIEAARAGDAGRGFAVVADEVRKLAEKTMTATKEVGEAIRGIQDGTKKNIENVERSGGKIVEATKLANKSGESLKEIVTLVESTTDLVRSIATASEEQASASEEINHSIEDVSRISSETADAMRQSAQAVGELANQSLILRNLIQEMQTDAGAGQTTLQPGRKTHS